MSQNSLEGFGAYRLAMEFFDLVLRADHPAKRRYLRMKHWLPADIITDRRKRCDAILGILTNTIVSLRRNAELFSRPAPRPSGLVPL